VSEPVAEQVHDVTVTVNGVPRTARVPARRLLSDFLRHDLGLTGTHVGCEHGVCGACTVLVDGQPMRSCLMFAVSAQAHAVTTVEGIGNDPEHLSPVQQAFAECHGLQCGFCTPGFVTTITAYLEENDDPTPEEAREAISGNLCRCTGYQNIVKAVCRAAEIRRTEIDVFDDSRTPEGPADRTEIDVLDDPGAPPVRADRTEIDVFDDSRTPEGPADRTEIDVLDDPGTHGGGGR
jgi:carbon-monoxide dehydrogenase small subunit